MATGVGGINQLELNNERKSNNVGIVFVLCKKIRLVAMVETHILL